MRNEWRAIFLRIILCWCKSKCKWSYSLLHCSNFHFIKFSTSFLIFLVGFARNNRITISNLNIWAAWVFTNTRCISTIFPSNSETTKHEKNEANKNEAIYLIVTLHFVWHFLLPLLAILFFFPLLENIEKYLSVCNFVAHVFTWNQISTHVTANNLKVRFDCIWCRHHHQPYGIR